MGVIRAGDGDSDGAIEAWSAAVALDRRQYDALYNVSVVAAGAGRHDVARSALRQFIETAPAARYAADIAKARAMLTRFEG